MDQTLLLVWQSYMLYKQNKIIKKNGDEVRENYMWGIFCPFLTDDIYVYKLFLWKNEMIFSEINLTNWHKLNF